MAASRIALVPTEEVMWNVQEMPDIDGVLYTAPDVNPGIVDDTLAIARGDWQNMPPRQYVNRGAYGAVSRIGDVAFKRSNFDYDESFSPVADLDITLGLSAMRATVMLHTGLKKQAQDQTDTSMSYSSPELYACFIANDPQASNPKTTWAMSYERGRQPRAHSFGLPDYETRLARYEQAIEMCGGDPSSVHYDDGVKNLLVKRTLIGRVKQIVKLDVTAKYIYKWDS